MIIEASPVVNPKAVTYNHVLGHRRHVLLELCESLTHSLKSKYKSIADEPLPFEVCTHGIDPSLRPS